MTLTKRIQAELVHVNERISYLHEEWNRLDSQGNQTNAQSEIVLELLELTEVLKRTENLLKILQREKL